MNDLDLLAWTDETGNGRVGLSELINRSTLAAVVFQCPEKNLILKRTQFKWTTDKTVVVECECMNEHTINLGV